MKRDKLYPMYSTIMSSAILLLAIACHQDHKDEQPKGTWDEQTLIVGNFTGKKRLDTLKEMLFSRESSEEANANPDSARYDSTASLRTTNTFVKLVMSNPKTISLAFGADNQISGLNYLNNIGDNNKNGKDEIAVIVNWVDESNVNSIKIYELNEELTWKELASYATRDFDNVDSLFFRNSKGTLMVHTYNEIAEPMDSVVSLNK